MNMTKNENNLIYEDDLKNKNDLKNEDNCLLVCVVGRGSGVCKAVVE